MLHDLAGQIVKQVGMGVVRDIVEINEPAHDVILQPRFLNAALAQRNHILLIRAQMLDPKLLRYRRIVERTQIERERIETRLNLARGHDKDAGNINGLLDHQLRGLCDNGRDVGLGLTPSISNCAGAIGPRLLRPPAACTSVFFR